jgi:hypothetical protein
MKRMSSGDNHDEDLHMRLFDGHWEENIVKILFLVHLETLKMGQTSSPETLVSYQTKTTLGKNPKHFVQHYEKTEAFNHKNLVQTYKQTHSFREKSD